MLYGQGCTLNDGASCVPRGALLLAGASLPQDQGGAAAMFRQGCELGNGEGCAAIGSMLVQGNGMPADIRAGAVYFRRGVTPAIRAAVCNSPSSAAP